MQGTKVIPLLFSLEFSDISGPLAQFQAKKFERSGLAEVIHSINQSTAEPIPEDRARQLFNALWPELEKQLDNIPEVAPTEKHTRPAHEILEELVTGVRGLDTRFRDVENIVTRDGPRSRRRRLRHFHPGMFEEMAEIVSEEGNDPVSLLMFGGLFRDDFPWLYEILAEAYREIRDGDTKAAQKAIERLRRVTRAIGKHPFFDEILMDLHDKESHMMMRELPMMLDHFLHRFERRQLKGSSELETDESETPSE